jgi:hypothetical protein
MAIRLDAEQLEPLIRLVDDRASGAVEPALGAMVNLPLEAEAWRVVGDRVLELLDGVEVATGPTAPAPVATGRLLPIAAHVPLREVRTRLHALVRSPDPGLRRQAAHALAAVRDPAAVPQLLEDLSGTDAPARREAIEDILFVDRARLDRRAVKSLTRASREGVSPETDLYAAVALGGVGRARPLIRLLDTMRERGSPFPGAPPDFSILRALPPLPEKVRRRLSRYTKDGDPFDLARGIAESLLAASAQPGKVVTSPAVVKPEPGAVEQARQLATSYLQAERGVETLREDIGVLCAAPTGVAERLTAGLYRRIADESDGMRAVEAGNSVAELVSRFGVDLEPDLGEYFDLYRRLSVSAPTVAEQVAWTVSRARPTKLLADLAELYPRVAAEDRARLAHLVEQAVLQAPTANPPVHGSGGQAKALPTEIVFVEGPAQPAARPTPRPEPPPAAASPAAPPEPPPAASRGGLGGLLGGLFGGGGRRSTRAGGAGAGSGAPPPPPPRDPREMAAPPEPRDPPRRFYALLDCPEAVVCEEEFELEVGLSKLATPGVVAEPLVRPESSVGDYDIAVHVLADGFTARPDESLRVVLPVTAEAPYPVAKLHLRAMAQSENVKARSISATYTIDGLTIGVGMRSVAVVARADLLDQAPQAGQERGVDIRAPLNEPPADLTLNIRRSESRFWITLENAHGLPVPEDASPLDIEDAREFARQLVDSVNEREGKPGSYRHLLGKARTVADRLPDAFWQLLRDVTPLAAAENGRTPRVLILSAEPFIPWELAAMPEPIDPDAPPFLAAQTDVGRWILSHGFPTTPPTRHTVENLSVVAGLYHDPKWSRLEHAEAEAEALKQAYGAHFVEATFDSVLGAIEGQPRADLVHLAIHGKYDPGGRENGLVLVDGRILDPDTLKGSEMPRPLFVFLNACQVGSSDAVLSDYAGIAASLLHLGAAGVIAPLWSIKDTHAQQIALDLYERLRDPEHAPRPSALLRHERRKFKQQDPPVSSTFLAYQFFGHPSLELRWNVPVAGGTDE